MMTFFAFLSSLSHSIDYEGATFCTSSTSSLALCELFRQLPALIPHGLNQSLHCDFSFRVKCSECAVNKLI